MTPEEAWTWVVENDRLIWKIAGRFVQRHQELDLDDYHVEGQIAAFYAIQKYDPEKSSLGAFMWAVICFRLEDAHRRLSAGHGQRVKKVDHPDGWINYVNLTKDGELPESAEADPGLERVEDAVYADQLIKLAHDPDIRQLLRRRYLDGRTLNELGEEYDVTGARICQRVLDGVRQIQRRVAA